MVPLPSGLVVSDVGSTIMGGPVKGPTSPQHTLNQDLTSASSQDASQQEGKTSAQPSCPIGVSSSLRTSCPQNSGSIAITTSGGVQRVHSASKASSLLAKATFFGSPAKQLDQSMSGHSGGGSFHVIGSGESSAEPPGAPVDAPLPRSISFWTKTKNTFEARRDKPVSRDEPGLPCAWTTSCTSRAPP